MGKAAKTAISRKNFKFYGNLFEKINLSTKLFIAFQFTSSTGLFYSRGSNNPNIQEIIPKKTLVTQENG